MIFANSEALSLLGCALFPIVEPVNPKVLKMMKDFGIKTNSERKQDCLQAEQNQVSPKTIGYIVEEDGRNPVYEEK